MKRCTFWNRNLKQRLFQRTRQWRARTDFDLEIHPGRELGVVEVEPNIAARNREQLSIAPTLGQRQRESEGFARDREATPRPHTNPMSIPSIDDVGDEESAGEESDQPAILRKREQASQTSGRTDFDSPENPLRQWDSEENEDAETEEEPETPTTGAAVLSDSDPSEESAPSDDPYEIPALRKRRRQRFFE